MTDGDKRDHQLKQELSALRAQIEALRPPAANTEPDPDAKKHIAALERRIEEIEEKLKRIILAAEIQRQQDA